METSDMLFYWNGPWELEKADENRTIKHTNKFSIHFAFHLKPIDFT